MRPISRPPVPSIEEIEASESAIEAECGEFMMAAWMGAVDDDMKRRWRVFYTSVLNAATPERKLYVRVCAGDAR